MKMKLNKAATSKKSNDLVINGNIPSGEQIETRVDDFIESEYGRGRILALTQQWIIHDNCLSNDDEDAEYALSISDDPFKLIKL